MQVKKMFRLSLVMLVLGGGLALACTVPVFRYALDHWPPDAYRLEAPVGWLASEAGDELRKLIEEGRAQIEVHPVAEPGAPSRLVMPDIGQEVWRGDLDGAASSLLSSPARAELLRRILAGESMVWIMVRSGNESMDQKFEEHLRGRLEYLQSVAAIPEQDPTDPINKLGPGPALKVQFSLLTVSRDDPEEQVLIRMLAGPEVALLEKEAPFGAVVFGRGRVLGAWPTEDLADEGIDEVSLFLLGACSCRVKFQNPGWDLALAVNWDEALLGAQMEADRENEERVEAAEESELAPQEAEEPAPAPELVRFGVEEGSRDNDAALSGASGTPGRMIGSLVAVVGVIALLCVFTGRADPKGS